MVNDMRAELGYEELPFIACELAPWRDASKGFNKRLPSITEYISNSSFITAQDCSMLKDKKDPNFGRDGQLFLGERYAAKVLRMCYIRPDFTMLTDDNHPRLFLKNEDFEILKAKNQPGTIVSMLHNILLEIADSEIASILLFRLLLLLYIH